MNQEIGTFNPMRSQMENIIHRVVLFSNSNTSGLKQQINQDNDLWHDFLEQKSKSELDTAQKHLDYISNNLPILDNIIKACISEELTFDSLKDVRENPQDFKDELNKLKEYGAKHMPKSLRKLYTTDLKNFINNKAKRIIGIKVKKAYENPDDFCKVVGEIKNNSPNPSGFKTGQFPIFNQDGEVKTLFQSSALTIVKEYSSECLTVLNDCLEQERKPNFLLSAIQAIGATALSQGRSECSIM